MNAAMEECLLLEPNAAMQRDPAPVECVDAPRPAVRVPWLTIGLIGLGVFLRLLAYGRNRSLWIDEAMLADNLVSRSWAGLLQSLDYHQAAPPGFLFIEKLFLCLLGEGEPVLRLWPLLAGILSLFLFHRVARRLLPSRAASLALGLFAVTPSLIYYSSEVKQYSSDVFWTLFCFIAAEAVSTRTWSTRASWLWGPLGAVAVWFSFPVVFVLAGLGSVWIVEQIRRRDGRSLVRLGAVIALWLVSFGIEYFVQLRTASNSAYLSDFWAGRFMPLPPRTRSDLGWFIDAFYELFNYPIGLNFGAGSLAAIGVLLFIVGCAALWTEQRRTLCLLLAPVLMTLLASGLHRYPFSGRLLLFLVPAVLLILAAGLELIRVRTAASLPLLGTALLGLLVFGPAATSARSLVQPHTVEEMRPLLGQVRNKWHENDLLYLYSGSEPAFAYYAPRFAFQPGDWIVGEDHRDDWSSQRADLRRWQGRQRLWVLFTHVRDTERQHIVSYLDEIGTRVDSVTEPGGVAYLYDLSK